MEDPAKRVFINPAVCEGCGDCSVQSNCISVEPLETEFGRKRQINQSTCNKDYSCLKGFCPSFVTVHGGKRRKRAALEHADADVPMPEIPVIGVRPWNIAITGVGGTGILTIGAILGMAAHLDGKVPMILDMAGLAQKGGAVMSHLRIGYSEADVTSSRIVTGGADLLIAADEVVGASKDAITLCASTAHDRHRQYRPDAGRRLRSQPRLRFQDRLDSSMPSPRPSAISPSSSILATSRARSPAMPWRPISC